MNDSNRYDRTEEDLGNIVEFGHVNITVPDQLLATVFYISGLGLTRDPYLMTGIDNMWVNVGRAQFHLPVREPQVLRGVVGLVLPDLEALLRRLSGVRQRLQGTKFGFRENGSAVEVTCPWGNRLRCHAPGSTFGPVTLGMPYVEFAVPRGALDGIARFYRDVLGALAGCADDAGGRYTHVGAGEDTKLIFRETDAPLPPFDGHHVQISLQDFSAPHRRLQERGLITEESDQHQYRFQDIVDPENGKVLFTVEHEVRSMKHPMFARPLVNRNAAINNRSYRPGHEAWPWAGASVST
jgi:predicted enzyme related to lactoylglutathione lyase